MSVNSVSGWRRPRFGAVVGLSLVTLVAIAFFIMDLVDMRGWNLVGGLAVVLSGLITIGLGLTRFW